MLKDLWGLLKGLDTAASKSPLYNLLTKLAALSFLWATTQYVLERPVRIAGELTASWNVVLAREGMPGDRGRAFALAQLTKHGQNLNNLDLRGLEATDLILVNPRMDDVDLDSASLVHARIKGGTVRRSCFRTADFGGATLTNVRALFSFWNHASLYGATLSGITLNGASMDSVDGNNVMIRESAFDDVSMRGTQFAFAVVKAASFRGADLRGTEWRMAETDHVIFTGARLDSADFHRTNLYASDLTFASLRGANLDSAKLNGVLLEGADLSYAVLPSNLRHAGVVSLKAANIYGVTGITKETLSWAIDTMGAVMIPWDYAYIAARTSLPEWTAPEPRNHTIPPSCTPAGGKSP